MPDFPNLNDSDELWPDEGYVIIVEDEYKPPDSDDFVNVLDQFKDPDFELPVPKSGYSYWVHDSKGNSYSYEEWQEHKEQHLDTE